MPDGGGLPEVRLLVRPAVRHRLHQEAPAAEAVLPPPRRGGPAARAGPRPRPRGMAGRPAELRLASPGLAAIRVPAVLRRGPVPAAEGGGGVPPTPGPPGEAA